MDRGGIETLLMSIYRNIDRGKIQFDFLLTHPEEGAYDREIIQLGGKIFHIRPRREGILKNRADLKSFFENHDYSIVHAHVSSMTYIEPIKVATKNNIPNRIIHCHNTKGPKGLAHELMHRFNRLRIDQYCTDKFACSSDAAIWGFGEKALKNGQVKIFKNAIDTSSFVFDPELRRRKRLELNLKDSYTVGHVGRFSEQKNHEFIIKVFYELNKTKPNSTLILVGVGELEEKIKKNARNLGLDDSVRFLGSRADVNQLMQAMDVFLFPSLYEGLGIVAIEAQAADLPVFASNLIPKEADITELFQALSLNNHPRIWAEEILKQAADRKRKDRTEDIVDNNYDIRVNTEWLRQYYMGLPQGLN